VGSPATLCTGTACASPVSATATFDNESTTATQDYNVTVTCTGASGQATSVTKVTAQKKGGTPPNCLSVPNTAGGSFTRVTGNIVVNDFHSNRTVDSTSFDSAFLAPWPGNIGTQIQFPVPRGGFISLAFTVPLGFSVGQLPTFYGEYEMGASGFSAPTSMTISSTCGDFSNPFTNSSSTVLCWGNNLKSSGFIQWHINSQGGRCSLVDGQPYYLNFINATIDNVLPNGGGSATTTANTKCTGTACSDPVEIIGADWK